MNFLLFLLEQSRLIWGGPPFFLSPRTKQHQRAFFFQTGKKGRRKLKAENEERVGRAQMHRLNAEGAGREERGGGGEQERGREGAI